VYLPRIDALPQITPLPQKEEILNKDYVRSSLSSSLTSLHFRNQLNLFPAYFENFQTLSKDTWPGLSIRELTGKGGNPHETLALLVQDGDFVAEVAWMGHGLQMWLQTIWFLSRTIGSSTIILDEPDVYLHADLQRKLIRILKLSAKQVIIATHSLEIMAEVDAQDVLIINRNAKESLYASSIPIVQRVIDNIGGVHNLQLTRLWHSQRCLLVEGKDVSLLKLVQNILYPESELPLDTIPNMPLGGWSGWNYAIGSKLILKNAVDDDITVYCILDSDYHTPNEIQERINQAKEKGIDLHIWKKKEIENYFIVPEAIQRIIADENKKDIHPPTIDLILEVLDQLLEKQKDNIFDAISTEFLAKDKAGGVTKANNKARSRIEEAWKTRNGRLSIVSGKKILSELSNWSQDMFGVSLSAAKLLRKLHKGEIETEVVSVIKAIEKGSNFISRNL
jgi:hypothetical protein